MSTWNKKIPNVGRDARLQRHCLTRSEIATHQAHDQPLIAPVRRVEFSAVLTLLFIALAIVCAGCKTQMAPTRHGIPNFRWVCMEEGICAGGEPTPSGYDWLLAMEITNVVQLNPGARPIPDGLSVTRLPVTTWEQVFGGRAMTEKLDAASVLIMMPSTFVHCQHGANRTGAVVLRRRIVIDGWDHRAAMEEADEHGWESSLPGLKAYGKKIVQKATQRPRRLPWEAPKGLLRRHIAARRRGWPAWRRVRLAEKQPKFINGL